MTKKTSESQLKAISEYRKKNPEKTRYYSYRSTSRTFINNCATLEDLNEFEQLINEKRKKLEEK